MNKLVLLALSIIGAILIIVLYTTYYKMQIDDCYVKCSDYHLSGEPKHWNFIEYFTGRSS